MSSSEQDFSESSNIESPFSQSDSPYSSPSQQVPQLANFLTVLSCAENSPTNNDSNKIYLRIVEQPQNHFRFRYRSEMIGTHGCLLGKSYASSKTKTHPTVELMNYTGQALIRCRLAQHDNTEEHPHKLLEEDQDRDVSTKVPEHGSYKVGFPGMGIIHTAKKDVPHLLFKKYESRHKNKSFDEKAMRAYCENIAKNINLNIVRLKFSAHDIFTDKEICPPVFSEPIHNMKSAATNDLKICRISRCTGRPKGGDDVFLLVEKVNKKNIMIRFYELAENGEECWSAQGNFLQSDVHHQYAIVFRTPPYKDEKITSDVKVMMELVRPSDGRTSEPKEFTYKANLVYAMNKKRKANSSFSSIESNSNSIRSLSDFPVPLEMFQKQKQNEDEVMNELPSFAIPMCQTPLTHSSNDVLVGEAIYYNLSSSTPNSTTSHLLNNPMLDQPIIEDPPVLQLNSSEIDRLVKPESGVTSEKKQFFDMNWSEYFITYSGSLQDGMSGIEFSKMVPDSARIKTEEIEMRDDAVRSNVTRVSNEADQVKTNIVNKKNSEYSAYYKNEDGNEVKTLVKDLCDVIKNKTVNKDLVRSKLERLFELRLSNGDTFLHMMLCSNQPSFEYIVKLIHSMHMTHLLNITNNQGQSILHLAVINDLPHLVKFLVSKGCNPMTEDKEGNNVIHYAVIYQACLAPLLEAIKENQVNIDINAYNDERQTALHLSAGSERGSRALLAHGAAAGARDAAGRAALHLAAYDDRLPLARALLARLPPDEIDAIDGRGNTALQVVCGGALRPNSIKIAKLLLEKNADPCKHEDYNQPAWRMAQDKPELFEVIKTYLPSNILSEAEVKSEPEDEFESADEAEGPEGGLCDLGLYVEEVSRALDAAGAWRQLAERLQRDSLLSWYAAAASPTRTLLTHLKECDDDITSKSLALLLDDMGQKEAANIIRRYI